MFNFSMLPIPVSMSLPQMKVNLPVLCPKYVHLAAKLLRAIPTRLEENISLHLKASTTVQLAKKLTVQPCSNFTQF